MMAEKVTVSLRCRTCNDGWIRIFSCGRRDNLSLKPPAIVLTARRRLEHSNLEGGEPGIALRILM
jgi:hypothetical protein